MISDIFTFIFSSRLPLFALPATSSGRVELAEGALAVET